MTAIASGVRPSRRRLVSSTLSRRPSAARGGRRRAFPPARRSVGARAGARGHGLRSMSDPIAGGQGAIDGEWPAGGRTEGPDGEALTMTTCFAWCNTMFNSQQQSRATVRSEQRGPRSGGSCVPSSSFSPSFWTIRAPRRLPTSPASSVTPVPPGRGPRRGVCARLRGAVRT
jgi:hypothetical protein